MCNWATLGISRYLKVSTFTLLLYGVGTINPVLVRQDFGVKISDNVPSGEGCPDNAPNTAKLLGAIYAY